MDEKELEEIKERLKGLGIQVVAIKEAPDNQRAVPLKISEKVSVRRFRGEKGDRDGSTTN